MIGDDPDQELSARDHGFVVYGVRSWKEVLVATVGSSSRRSVRKRE